MHATGVEKTRTQGSGKNKFRIGNGAKAHLRHIREIKPEFIRTDLKNLGCFDISKRPIVEEERMVGFLEQRGSDTRSKAQEKKIKQLPELYSSSPKLRSIQITVKPIPLVNPSCTRPLKNDTNLIKLGRQAVATRPAANPSRIGPVRSTSVQTNPAPRLENRIRKSSMENKNIIIDRNRSITEDKRKIGKAEMFRSEINTRNCLAVVPASGSGLGIYKYYIYKYNNPALIKRCFGRRPWWKEMKESQIKQCNVVWTQFPISWVYNIPTMPFLMPQQSLLLDPVDQTSNTPVILSFRPSTFISQRAVVANRLPQNIEYGHKHLMTFSLKDYCSQSSISISDLIPETYCVSSIDDIEHEDFVKTAGSEEVDSLWIIKPAAFTFGGAGIEIACGLKSAEEIIRKKIGISRGGQGQTLIVQRYISNPLLYKGRKFDIRAFCLINSVNKCVQAYFHKDGYVRTSSREFTTSNYLDMQVHLTNDCAQKTSDTYGRYESSNKVLFEDFYRVISEDNKNSLINKWSLDDSNLALKIRDHIYQQMKVITRHLVLATFNKFDTHRKVPSFELVGLDFMITKELKVFLIEANNSPSLSHSDNHALNKLLEDILEHTFEIAVDPLFPPVGSNTSTTISQNPKLSNRFELILEDTYE